MSAAEVSIPHLFLVLAALTACIEKNRPVGCKGRRARMPTRVARGARALFSSAPPRRLRLWKTATLCSTMGPPVKLDIAALRAFGTEGEAAA